MQAYSRVVMEETQHTCSPLSLSAALTYSVRDHLMARDATPIELQDEINDMKDCPRLNQIGIDLEFLKF